MVLVGASFWLGSEPSRESGSADSSARQTIRMRAGPFRAEIQRLEWILYAQASEGLSDARELRALLVKLAHEMRAWERVRARVFDPEPWFASG